MEDVINYLRKVRRGTMFIIEGPSGAGKGTVIKEILARDPHIKFSVSVTTRPQRHNEVDGVDYYFITDQQYDQLIKEDAFTNMSTRSTETVTELCVRKWTVLSMSAKMCCLISIGWGRVR